MRLYHLLLAAAILGTCLKAQDLKAPSMEEFQAELETAALEVVRQHQYDLYPASTRPPDFDAKQGFMRSFVPNSGVGNREEILIDRIRQIPMFDDSSFTRWQHKRYNHTDFVMGFSKTNAVLQRVDVAIGDYFVFSKDDAVLTYTSESRNIIVDVTMFTVFVKRVEVLYIALLTENPTSSLITIYEIIANKAVLVTLIDLGVTHVTSKYSAKKLSFVQSQHGGSVVVLIADPDKSGIIYQRKGSSELSHYIEVHYPGAVDLITFTIHGYGYIAVANGTSAEVYKMDEFARSHLLFDRIPLQDDIVDLEYFRLGFLHYVAVVGESTQSLYVWRNGGFFPKQMFLGSSGVQQIYSTVLPSCRDDVLLVRIRNYEVDVYVWNGQQEMFVVVKNVIPPGLLIKPGSLTSFGHKNQAFLLFLDPQDVSQVFAIETSLVPVRDPVLNTGSQVAEYMRSLQAILDEQNRQLKTISGILVHAVRKEGDQHLKSFQSFENIQTSQETVVKTVDETLTIQWEGSNLSQKEYETGTNQLEEEVNALEKALSDVEKAIPDVVMLNEDALITGSKRFTGDISGSLLFAQSLYLKSVGDIDVPQLQKDVYRLDKPQQIKGMLTFEKPLTITENLEVERTVNGVDISDDVMTTDTEQESQAHMIFDNKLVVTGDLDLSGLLNGIDIGKEVVTLNGNHMITGNKTFQNGIMANQVETRYLDGIDIQNLFDSAFTQSSNQHIPGKVTFNGGLSAKNILLGGTLNGYDIDELAKSIVRIDTPAYITGHKTFLDDVSVQGDLDVGGTVNGLRIPDDLFLRNRPQVVTGTKRFMGEVTASNVTVDGLVDGLKIPEDIVTLTRDETVTSTLNFEDGISVMGDIVVGGLVDGVDISQLAKDALKSNETREIENAVFLGPVTITEDLSVQGTVNKMSLDDIVNDIVFKDDVDIIIGSKKRFRKVIADSVRVKHMINGYNINEDFMTVTGDQVIKGTKVFKKPVTFTSVTTANDLIDGVNIVDLYENRITLSVNQDIPGDVEFVDHLIVDGDLTIHGQLNGLTIPDDVVLRNTPRDTPISNKIFKGPVQLDNLLVDGNVDISGTFGGVDLVEFNRSRVTLTGDQVIQGDLWLGGDVAVKSLDVSGSVNGRDFVEFAKNVMSLTKDQNITGAKEFSGTVTVKGPITTVNGVNGINLQDLKNRAFKLNEPNFVTEPFEFEDITVNNMTVDGLVNGVNITELDADSLKTKGLQYVTGKNTFLAGFHVAGDIIAGTVNDMVIREDVLLKNYEQTITGKYTVGDLFVEGNVDIDGLINGLDLSKISTLIAKSDQDSVVVSNLTFKAPIHVLKDIEVTGSVNGINLKQLSESSLMKGGDQEVGGHKILRGNVTILGDVDVKSVNGVNWSEFLEDVVRIDIPQTVKAPKVLDSDSEVHGDIFVTGLAEVGLINGIDLKQFISDAVFVDEPANITGKKVFTNTMQISGDLDSELINGLRLRTDVITVTCSGDSPQVITGKKTFSNLTLLGNMAVGGKVNGYNLKELYDDTLLTEGDQIVFGQKTIRAPVRFMKNVYPDTVNGLVLSRDLVTLHGDHVINGPLTFKGDVIVEGNLEMTGLLNGVDLQQLSRDAVYLDTEQEIDGSFTFHNAIVASDVAVDGNVNGFNLPDFDRNVTDFWRDVQVGMRQVNREVDDQCVLSKYLHSVLEKSYYVLDGFVAHQDLGVPANHIEVSDSMKELLMVQFDGLPTSTVNLLKFVWSDNGGSYDLASNETTSIKRSLSYVVASSRLTVHIGVKAKDSSITVDGLQISQFPRGFKTASALVQEKAVFVALLYPARGVCDIYKIVGFDITPVNPNLESNGNVIVGREATSVALFEVSGVLYLAFSCRHSPPYSNGASKIYSWNNGNWQVVQNIQAPASSFVLHFPYHGYHYLAFTNAVPIYEAKEPKAIQIYRNTGPNHMIFSLFQKVPFDDAKGLDVFEFGGLSELYMTAWNGTRVQVFRLEGEAGFRSNFTLHGKCITHVKPFVFEQIPFLAVAQRNQLPGEVVTSVLYKGLTQGSMLPPKKFEHCSAN